MKTKNNHWLILALAAMTALGAQGCGDDSTGSSSSSSSSSSSGGGAVRVVAENSDGTTFDIIDTIFFGNGAANATAPTDQISDDDEGTDFPALNEVSYTTDPDRGNMFVNPELTNITVGASLDLTPKAGSPALDCPAPAGPGIDTSAAFCGAFAQGDNWMEGWTTFGWTYPDNSTAVTTYVTGNAGTATWSGVVVIDGRVFVEAGDELTIEAGTYVYAKEGAWIQVNRGAKINVQGTASEPVIITSIKAMDGDISDAAAGDWSGLVLLGEATNNVGTDAEIEGNGGTYGGSNDNDSSGSIEYLRLEYVGYIVGADNELNGLTMGSVGSGTTLSYIQVHEGLDDGFEWFGGTANADHLVASHIQDDCFDTDEGVRTTIQFAVCIQPTGAGDHGIEGASNPDDFDAEPRAEVIYSNLTFVGNGEYAEGSGIKIKEGQAGTVQNAIVINYSNAVDLDEYFKTNAE